jgi:dTDP-4-dehydrorhamnose reductase
VKILVTGKTGQVGRCLIAQGEDYGFTMVGLSRSELDITSPRHVNAVITNINPDLVINAAAYTAVDKAENDSLSAYSTNENGPLNLSVVCRTLEIPLFHISTDYVFSGDLIEPYKEFDKANPISIYGKSKLMGELAIMNALSNFIILRTSWVFSEYGDNFVRKILGLVNDRDTLAIVSDQVGGPTSAESIAKVLLSLSEKYQRRRTLQWGIYHFSQKPYVSWYQLTQQILENINLEKKVKLVPIPSSAYPTLAQRPRNSRLCTSKIESYLNISANDWIDDLNFVTSFLKK